MSTKRSGKNRDLPSSYQWSDWAWDEHAYKWYRARLNLKGKTVFEYQSSDTAVASSSIPRSETYSSSIPAFDSSSTNTTDNYYQNSSYAYQGATETSDPIGSLSEGFAQTSISSEQPQASSSNNYYGGQSGAEVPGARSNDLDSSKPVQIPSDSSRSIPTTSHDDYSSTTPVNRWGAPSSGVYPMISSETASQQPADYYQEQPSQIVRSSMGMYRPGLPSTFNSYNQSMTSETLYGFSTMPQFTSQLPYESAAAQNSGDFNPPEIHKRISGTGGRNERLDPNYKVHDSYHFTHGAVFKILWVEPAGQTAPSDATTVTSCEGNILYDQNAYASIRRFVIVATGNGHSQCLPISTYNMRATTKRGVNAEDHAIIWTKQNPRDSDRAPGEIPGEAKLALRPVEVIPKTPRDKLAKQSRLNYGKTYTIEHNVKVVFIGHVARSSQHNFVADRDAVWARRSYASQ